MSFLEGTYKQDITYWDVAEVDGYGKDSFETPVLIKGRWQDRVDQLITFREETSSSKAELWLPSLVTVGGYLALGDLTATADPLTVDNAHIIKRADSIPDLHNTLTIYKAWL